MDNVIYNEDCFETFKRIDDKSIDMILCDLPYGTTACKWDTRIPLEPLWKEYKRIIKKNGAIVLTASQPFTSILVMSNIEWFRYCWVWDKGKAGNIMCSSYQPMKVHEDILIFSKSKTTFNRQMTEAKPENIRPTGKEYKNRQSIIGIHNWKHSKSRDNTKRNPKSIIDISSVSKECNNLNRIHPTQKPVALFEYLIKTYTNEGELVLDNCIGSGTTAIACINTNRHFIGCELDKGYYDIAVKRVEEARYKVKLL